MNKPANRSRNIRQATPRRGAEIYSGRMAGLVKVLGRLVLAGCVVASIVGAYFYGDKVWQHGVQQPVESVKVEGEFKHLSRDEASRLIGEAINQDFVNLNIAQLKKLIEQHPWVERAIVARGLSRTLRVTIIEQTPIAVWGEAGYLNQRGQVIHTDKVQGLAELPVLDGREQDSEKIMRQFQDLSQMVRSRNLGVRQLWVDELGSWTVKLDGGVQLMLGKDQLPEKVQRFLVVYDEYLVQRFDAVERVDLRYANGLAVAWSDSYNVSVEVAG
ncbi:cell division protein FtsQ/DivIB [Gilvimarinus agarilyticus]|uniref:cell division protein FtsQ/DivIB n=1 Tax=unclassified Gilvimarinus TaxID=2642066 RepID=UPI001C084A48|nr:MULTISPECIES: cell division protein FtsQ/DivIB [unclassified Gilvimarinus]MBU2885405.1 cell division protein FtsQ/DivIB [Gilvimarinus agarilyticus]MDO6570304.1 cell division protein FtsQ/DivIB [Gilvimarinus sp. 2_MG-2023]MDO6746908.1 cell division protein FtsQ/DivIB [Gilvimarinus sp. 1_MG-2023]